MKNEAIIGDASKRTRLGHTNQVLAVACTLITMPNSLHLASAQMSIQIMHASLDNSLFFYYAFRLTLCA